MHCFHGWFACCVALGLLRNLDGVGTEGAICWGACLVVHSMSLPFCKQQACWFTWHVVLSAGAGRGVLAHLRGCL
eukprot:9135200-Lingulodinium_polyedra.AAC.1